MSISTESGYQSDGLAFLFGLLSVQWTMTDYDAVAHISFEVRRAAYAAPVALFTAVLGTGMIGWLLNVSQAAVTPAQLRFVGLTVLPHHLCRLSSCSALPTSLSCPERPASPSSRSVSIWMFGLSGQLWMCC